MTKSRSRRQRLLSDKGNENSIEMATEMPFDPTALDGFRLHRLEILNWGTFDEQVHVFHLDGKTTLLVGQNGSGKSTLVDAVLTLLVPSAIRNYNVAAGGKKRERSEVSYIQGAYGQFGDEDDLRTKTRYLRDKSNKPTILLACFRNAAYNQVVTLAQILYLDAEGRTAKHIFCFDNRERRIQGDLYPIDLSDRIISKLKDKGFAAWNEFVHYQNHFLKAFNLKEKGVPKEKAMDVFNQTVAVKDIQKLDTFIRQHMLDAVSWKDKINPVVAHFTDLKNAYESLVRVKAQYDQLLPIKAEGEKYRQIDDEHKRTMGIYHAADVFESQKWLDFAIPDHQRKVDELKSVNTRLESLKEALKKSRQAKVTIEIDLANIGGEKRQLLELKIDQEEQNYKEKQAASKLYHGLLEQIGIKEQVANQDSFHRMQERIQRKKEELQKRSTEGQAKRDSLLLPRDKEHEKLEDDKKELSALEQRQTNLPESCVAMRRQICDGLGLDEKTLPFAAELIAVLPAESAWEASIEKLLHNFALNILVPNEEYAKVARFVEKNRMLDERKRGGLLNYQPAGITIKSPPTVEKPDGVYAKLNIKKNDFTPWLKDTLKRRFDYLCCEDIESFRKTSERAMTKNRHIKHGNNRHEKDDRSLPTDRSCFVLGWDNREKRRFLKERIEETQKVIDQYNEKIDDWNSTLIQLRYQLDKTTTLLEKRHFLEIDIRSHENTLSDLRQQLHLLIEGNETAKILEERKRKVEGTISQQEQEQEITINRQGSLEMEIKQISVTIKECETTIEKSEADGTLSTHQTYFDDWETRLEDHFRNDMIGCRERCQEIKSDLLDGAKRLEREMDPVKKKIEMAMVRYVQNFPEDKMDLSASVSSLRGFESILSRIEKDDLPRHQEKFREYLNDKVTLELQSLATDLKNEQREVRKKIAILNTSLQQLEYRPGTYMRLEARDSHDPQILEFRRKMSECLDGTFEAGFSGGEERYKKLQKLISELETEQGWTEKVVDVRRWFTFLARELDAETNESKYAYEDSSGQSGGEKAKLAFTILVASIAYQYDIDPGRVPSDRFHFVMVDEMFSKVDDQFSEYALKLFEKFRLQLLIVAPLDAKARVTEPFVKRYLHIVKDSNTNRSRVYKMTAKEFEEYVDEVNAN